MERTNHFLGNSISPLIKKIKIYVTEHCNEACVYCPIHVKEKKQRGETLNGELIGKITKEAISMGYDHIKLSGEFGDPLVKKDILEIVKEINKNSPYEISIATNGLLLPPIAEDLIANGVNKFCISLDTLDSSKYKSLTGKSNIETVKESIKITGGKLGKKVKVNMVVMKDVNETEIDEMRAWVHSTGATLQLIELYLVPGKESFFENHYFDLTALSIKLRNESHYYEQYKPRRIERFFLKENELVEITSLNKFNGFNFGNLRLLIHSNGDIGNYDVKRTGLSISKTISGSEIRALLERASEIISTENVGETGIEEWIYGVGEGHKVS